MASSRSPWWGRALGLWAAPTAVAWLLRAGPLSAHAAARDDSWPLALQAALTLAPLLALLLLPPVRRVLDSWPSRHLAAVALAIGLVQCGHLVEAKRATFPFGDWQMFTRPWSGETVVVHRFEAVTTGGRQFELNPVRLVPSLGKSRFWVGFIRFGEYLVATGDEELLPTYDRLLLGLVELHDQRHPADPIREVRVSRTELPIGANGEPISHELWRVVPATTPPPRADR